MAGKAKSWCKEVELLSQVALNHPRAALLPTSIDRAASGHMYISRTIPGIDHLFKLLEQVIQEKFIPAITRRPSCSKNKCSLLALPAGKGGLGANLLREVCTNTRTEPGL